MRSGRECLITGSADRRRSSRSSVYWPRNSSFSIASRCRRWLEKASEISAISFRHSATTDPTKLPRSGARRATTSLAAAEQTGNAATLVLDVEIERLGEEHHRASGRLALSAGKACGRLLEEEQASAAARRFTDHPEPALVAADIEQRNCLAERAGIRPSRQLRCCVDAAKGRRGAAAPWPWPA